MTHFEEDQESTQLSMWIPSKYSTTQKFAFLAIIIAAINFILFIVILGVLMSKSNGVEIMPSSEMLKSNFAHAQQWGARDDKNNESGPPAFTLETKWKGNTYRYYIGDELVNWFQAKTKCRSQGFEPMVVDSVAERDFVIGWLRVKDSGIPVTAGTYVWTSGYRDYNLTHWLWDITGEPLSHHLWSPGEPNNHAGNQRCVLFYFINPNNVIFADGFCNQAGRYICKLKQ